MRTPGSQVFSAKYRDADAKPFSGHVVFLLEFVRVSHESDKIALLELLQGRGLILGSEFVEPVKIKAVQKKKKKKKKKKEKNTTSGVNTTSEVEGMETFDVPAGLPFFPPSYSTEQCLSRIEDEAERMGFTIQTFSEGSYMPQRALHRLKAYRYVFSKPASLLGVSDSPHLHATHAPAPATMPGAGLVPSQEGNSTKFLFVHLSKKHATGRAQPCDVVKIEARATVEKDKMNLFLLLQECAGLIMGGDGSFFRPPFSSVDAMLPVLEAALSLGFTLQSSFGSDSIVGLIFVAPFSSHVDAATRRALEIPATPSSTMVVPEGFDGDGVEPPSYNTLMDVNGGDGDEDDGHADTDKNPLLARLAGRPAPPPPTAGAKRVAEREEKEEKKMRRQSRVISDFDLANRPVPRPPQSSPSPRARKDSSSSASASSSSSSS